MLTQTDYKRHLEGQLCWDCGVGTTRSHARQRQCPKCRKKWSYFRLQQEWSVLKEFCDGRNANSIGRDLHIAYATVQKYFRRFEEALRRSRTASGLSLRETLAGGEALSPATTRLALSTIFAELILPRFRRHGQAVEKSALPSKMEEKSRVENDFLLIS